MLNVNTIIQNAFQRCSLVGDGQAATGTQAMAALNDMNSLIAELNTQNYILSNVQSFDTKATDKLVIGIVPEHVHVFDFKEEMNDFFNNHQDEIEVDEICYLANAHNGYNYYFTRSDMVANHIVAISSPRFNERCKSLHLYPDVVVGKNDADINCMVDRVLGIGRRIGNRYVQLYPANKMKIDSFNKQHLSTLFAAEYENTEFLLGDREFHFERFVIDFDSERESEYRITYYEKIPDVKLTDNLYLDSKYTSMIEDGLCVKLCQRYKLMDIKADFEKDFNNQKALIKRINNANQPMLYDGSDVDSWSDRYWNGVAGQGW